MKRRKGRRMRRDESRHGINIRLLNLACSLSLLLSLTSSYIFPCFVSFLSHTLQLTGNPNKIFRRHTRGKKMLHLSLQRRPPEALFFADKSIRWRSCCFMCLLLLLLHYIIIIFFSLHPLCVRSLLKAVARQRVSVCVYRFLCVSNFDPSLFHLLKIKT